jgi:outer membrane protein assembly factor BamB
VRKPRLNVYRLPMKTHRIHGMGRQLGLLGMGAVLALSGFASATAAEPAWPGWRGPGGLGVVSEGETPEEWGPEQNVLWKTEIPGRGLSSPVVWGDRVILTTAIEGQVVPGASAPEHREGEEVFKHPDAVGSDHEHELQVIALDATTGAIRWRHTAYRGTPYDDRHKKASYASPTPVTDGKVVIASFGAEGLYAYDLDGAPLWKVDLGPVAVWGVGYGTSPLLFGTLVIVQCDEDNGERSYIAAFDKEKGQPVWRTARQVQASWATPILVETGERTELVTAGNEAIIAYDPSTGRELWRAKGLESNAIPSPVAGHGLVVVSAGYPKKLTLAIRPGGTGDVTGSDRITWTYDKGSAYVPSPILYGEHLYLVTDAGLLTCLDARTGRLVYEGGRVPKPARFTASPIAYGGKLLLLSEEGDGFLVKAGPVHEVIRTNPLGEPVLASPAVAGGRLYIRGERHLFCIQGR